MTKKQAAEMIKKHWRTKMAFTRALMKFADHPSAKFTATYGSVKRQTTGEGNVSNIHAMLYKALLKSKEIEEAKFTSWTVQHNGDDSSDFIIHRYKEIDGEMYYVKEQSGKILSKTLSKNIVR